MLRSVGRKLLNLLEDRSDRRRRAGRKSPKRVHDGGQPFEFEMYRLAAQEVHRNRRISFRLVGCFHARILPRCSLNQQLTDSLVEHDCFHFLQCRSRGANPVSLFAGFALCSFNFAVRMSLAPQRRFELRRGCCTIANRHRARMQPTTVPSGQVPMREQLCESALVSVDASKRRTLACPDVHECFSARHQARIGPLR
jgi:hypothetical protein